MEGVKEQVGIVLISKETLEHGHYYLGLRPTVDTALIPLVTPGFKDKTECIAICMTGSSFIHIETL